MFSKSLQSLLAVTSIASCAMAGAASAEQNDSIRQAYIEAFGQNSNGTVLDNLARVFQQFDSNGSGITADNISFVETMMTSQRRGSYAGQWLRFDMDGDVRVSRQEFEDMNTHRRFSGRKGLQNDARNKRIASELKKRVDLVFKSDLNSDGFIDGVELYQPQDRRDRYGDNEKNTLEFAKLLLKSDRNGDGVLTQIEASQLASESLVGVDEEIIKTAERREGNRALGMTDECPQINISKDSQLVMFGAYEGTSLSNVSVVGQDSETNGTTVFIENGEQPMTLFLSSFTPMVWQFKGATHRLNKVVVFGGTQGRDDPGMPAAGVVGIEKSKLQFVKGSTCFRYFYDADSGEALRAKAAVERMTGRAPDRMLGQYGITVAALPSGEGINLRGEEQDGDKLKTLIEKSGAEYFTVGEAGKLVPLDETAEHSSSGSEFLRFNPTGLMRFEAKDVISDAKVEPYEVYPEHAGLMQLEAQGKITNVKGQYRINEQIRFPAGLAGALSVSYVLPKGVGMPKGNVGHSCIHSDDPAVIASNEGMCVGIIKTPQN